MKKVILSFICAVALLSACEKVALKDPTTSPISAVIPSDTAKVIPPAATPPVATPPVTTPPVATPPVATPPVTTPPVTTPPVTTPPATTPPVTTPPATKPPVTTPPATTPPVTTPPATKPPVTTPPVTTPPVTTPPVTTPPVTTPPVTTPPVTVALSFSKDVIPVLNQCENCHSHGWTPSSVASTYYSNLVSKGYVVAATYTSSKIYTKLLSGHPGSGSISTANTNKIIDWMKAGSLNN